MVTLILNYKKNNSYALNVIAAAVSTASDLSDVPVVFARTRADLVKAAESAIAAHRIALVAWSFYSPSFRETYGELTELKAALSGAVHIAGGVHATAEPQQVLRAGFDLVAIGEGERTIVELLRCLKAKGDVGAVRGIGRIVEGQYRANGQGERIELDDFPANAWMHHKFNPIEITRGCIYACKFCQTPFMFKARFRHRSVKSICEYVRVMIERNYRDVRFITPTCLSYGSQDESVHLPAIEELLASVRAIVKDQGRIFFGTFPSEVRPEHVSSEALRMLKRYVDNDNLIIGGQSGSQRILDESKRGHSVQQITEAVRICRKEGFVPNVDFIFGLPGETPEDAAQSVRLVETLADAGARVHAHSFMPLPGTPYKNADFAPLDPGIEKRLRWLSSHGKVYGQWKAQQEISHALSRVRTAPAR